MADWRSVRPFYTAAGGTGKHFLATAAINAHRMHKRITDQQISAAEGIARSKASISLLTGTAKRLQKESPCSYFYNDAQERKEKKTSFAPRPADFGERCSARAETRFVTR